MKLIRKESILVLLIGIFVGILLCQMQIIPEMFKNTTSIGALVSIKFKNPEVYDKNLTYMHFDRNQFDSPGFYGRRGLQGTEDNYFVKIVHTNDGKKSMQFGDQSRDLQIENAKIRTRELRKDEKCIVKPREIILLPSDHEHAPDETVEYRI